MHDEMKNNIKTTTFFHMFPGGDELNEWSTLDEHRTIAIDDLLNDGCSNIDYFNMF